MNFTYGVFVMKKIFLFLVILFLTGCVSDRNTALKNNEPSVMPDVRTGWIDADSYAVRAVAENERKAIERAKHRILKDIVNARIMNGSRYSDISKIQEEFFYPLLKGRVIESKDVPGGKEVYFLITDKGLRQKFNRK